jgi:polyisoprenoid-binding protein YceI
MIATAVSLLFASALALAGPPDPPAATPPIWGRVESLHAELFGVDVLHSYLGFSVGFLGITRVRGTFNDYSACILYDEKDPAKTSATVVIDPASIDTGFAQRDKDLKDPRFFDVAKFPRIVFQTQSVERTGPKSYVVHATLEIKGIRRPIDLPMTQTGERGPDSAWGNVRIGGSGAVTVKRTDFGILGDKFWGSSSTIAEDVEISVELLGIRSNHDLWGWKTKEKPAAGELAWKTWQEKGLDAALAQYAELKQKQPEQYDFSSWQLTLLGLRLQQRGLFADALRVYEQALAENPEDPNLLWSRVGEIHAGKGDFSGAAAFYRKVLSRNPGSAEAIEMLRRLEPPVASSR